MVEVKVKIILSDTFKVKFMFEIAILYIIFNMATSNINKMSIYNKKKTKPFVATALTKNLLNCAVLSTQKSP